MVLYRVTTRRLYRIAVIAFAFFFVGNVIYKRIPCNNVDVVTTLQDSRQNKLFSQYCELLARLNAVQRKRAKIVFLRRKLLAPTPDWHFIRSTRYCDTFTHDQGYDMSAPSGEERNFSLAFGVRMHDSVAQAERLLRAIYRPHNVYCIHIDRASAPIVQTAMRSIVSCFPNVFVSSLYEDFVYRSFSPVKADLQCMRQLQSTRVSWQYYLNAHGTEFTLWTNLELVQLLKRMNGTNDIDMEQVSRYSPLPVTWRHVIFRRELQKDPLRYLNITMYKGSSYNVFSREFVIWLLGNRIAKQVIDWSRGTHSPDETVWATLNGMAGAPGGYVGNSTSNHTFASRRILWRTSDAFANHTC